MGRRPLDLKDQRFGLLVAKYPTGAKVHNNIIWRCVCDCGATREAKAGALTASDGPRSCGCVSGHHAKNRDRERETEVIRLRESVKPLAKVADALGVSAQRAHQIYTRAKLEAATGLTNTSPHKEDEATMTMSARRVHQQMVLVLEKEALILQERLAEIHAVQAYHRRRLAASTIEEAAVEETQAPSMPSPRSALVPGKTKAKNRYHKVEPSVRQALKDTLSGLSSGMRVSELIDRVAQLRGIDRQKVDNRSLYNSTSAVLSNNGEFVRLGHGVWALRECVRTPENGVVT